MDKAGLRQKYREKRQRLTAEEVERLSKSITNNLGEIIDWQKINSIHSYLPITKNSEIDTVPLLRAARQANPGLKIANTESQDAYWLDADLKPSKKVKEGFKFGLIIVPMLAFDKSGYRLGYGGGFYDRFLSTQQQALAIGLCYEHGFLPELPHKAYDIPLKTIVTEKAVHKF